MKKSLAVLLCSSAMVLAPGFAFASSGGGGNGGGTAGGEGQGVNTTSGNPPLTPSQTETSEGAAVKSPPLKHDGKYVTQKKDHTEAAGGSGGTGQSSGGSGDGPGTAGGEGR